MISLTLSRVRTYATERSPLRHYVAENHNVESAKDRKKGLEFPPGIAGMSLAEGESAMLAGAANNKIPEITKYNNFSLTSKSMRVWQAYNVGEGMDIEGSWNEQDVSGLERIGRKRYRVLHKRNTRQRENTMILSLSIFLAAFCLLVLPP